jgi:hypothetical protein
MDLLVGVADALGTDYFFQQKQRWIPAMARLEKISAFA